MAQAALPLMAAGALLKGVAGFQAGQYNAGVQRAQAQEELAMGVAEAAQVRDAARRTMVNQLGAMAESGFTIGEGSALGALEESLIAREVDVMQVQRTSLGRAAGLRAQARQSSRAGFFALAEGAIGAAGAISNYRADYAAASGGSGVGGAPVHGQAGHGDRPFGTGGTYTTDFMRGAG